MNGIFLAGDFCGLTGAQLLRQAYDAEVRAALDDALHLLPSVYSREEIPARAAELAGVEVIFSTWGMPSLTGEEIGRFFPRLRAVYYAAGTVRAFARPFLERGVRVYSAAEVNAVPVAEVAAAQIILANKGYFQSAARYRSGGWQDARRYYEGMPGNYRAPVGILGVGAIGRRVIGLLKAHEVSVLAYDPFLPEERAGVLGVTKAGLEEVFRTCGVISNHLADNAGTKGLLDYALFSSMGPQGVFINTGRGAQVVEAGLARALAEEPGRTAVLDVTIEEPVKDGHPFLTLPNVFLTPHIAGSSGGEIARMGRAMLEAFRAGASGGAAPGEITLEALETMA